jgi:hypothetical protein
MYGAWLACLLAAADVDRVQQPAEPACVIGADEEDVELMLGRPDSQGGVKAVFFCWWGRVDWLGTGRTRVVGFRDGLAVADETPYQPLAARPPGWTRSATPFGPGRNRRPGIREIPALSVKLRQCLAKLRKGKIARAAPILLGRPACGFRRRPPRPTAPISRAASAARRGPPAGAAVAPAWPRRPPCGKLSVVSVAAAVRRWQRRQPGTTSGPDAAGATWPLPTTPPRRPTSSW